MWHNVLDFLAWCKNKTKCGNVPDYIFVQQEKRVGSSFPSILFCSLTNHNSFSCSLSVHDKVKSVGSTRTDPENIRDFEPPLLLTWRFLSMIQFASKSSSSSPNGLISCSATCQTNKQTCLKISQTKNTKLPICKKKNYYCSWQSRWPLSLLCRFPRLCLRDFSRLLAL